MFPRRIYDWLGGTPAQRNRSRALSSRGTRIDVHNVSIIENISVALLCLCSEASTARRNVRISSSDEPTDQSARCQTLHHSNNGTRESALPAGLSLPRTLDFRIQPWPALNDELVAASIPPELRDMRLEDNRLASFRQLTVFPFFAAAEDLAADGFFCSQESNSARCAFCGVVLTPEHCQLAGQREVRAAHKCRSGTCPFLLYMEVGNVPSRQRASVDKVSTQCSEENDTGGLMVNGDWSLKLVDDSTEWPNSDSDLVQYAVSTRHRRPESVYSPPRELFLQHPAHHKRYHLPVRVPNSDNKEFDSLPKRLASMQSVPLLQPRELLASAGFFYSRSHRATRCFSCALHVNWWSAADNAWLLHARWSPLCRHVLGERGTGFVSNCSSACVTNSQFDCYPLKWRTKIEPDILATMPGVQFRVEAQSIRARMELPETRLLQKLGFPAAHVVKLRLRLAGDDFVSPELLLDFALKEHSQMCKTRLQSTEAYFRNRMAGLDRVRDAKPRQRSIVDWFTRKICKVMEINVILLHCKHLICCSNCAGKIQVCPVCKDWIHGTVLLVRDTPRPVA